MGQSLTWPGIVLVAMSMSRLPVGVERNVLCAAGPGGGLCGSRLAGQGRCAALCACLRQSLTFPPATRERPLSAGAGEGEDFWSVRRRERPWLGRFRRLVSWSDGPGSAAVGHRFAGQGLAWRQETYLLMRIDTIARDA